MVVGIVSFFRIINALLPIFLVYRRSSIIMKDDSVLILSLKQFTIVGSMFSLLLLCGLPFTHVLYLILPMYLSCVCYNRVYGIFGFNVENFTTNWHLIHSSEIRRKLFWLCISWLLLALSVGKFYFMKGAVDFCV